jgi:DNA-binding CsgD family transcriptional regulator
LYKQFRQISDSIQVQGGSNEIAKLKLQYDFEKAELEREQERNKIRTRYTIAIVILAAGLCISVLLVIAFRLRARQVELKQKNLKQDVEIKNKELTTNVMYLIRKNELINDVAERLLHIKGSTPPENQKPIHDIVLDLQREADSDSWKEFEMRFNQVHSDFYEKLRRLHPGLSPADEKLCAFLSLNMSSKEIATITKQHVRSLEVARTRLRKKLNLTDTKLNLITYLSNL